MNGRVCTFTRVFYGIAEQVDPNLSEQVIIAINLGQVVDCPSNRTAWFRLVYL